MPIRSLMLPQDITWTRMAFTTDMIDTNFGEATDTSREAHETLGHSGSSR